MNLKNIVNCFQEGVTIEEREEGLEIKETELCEKTLRHLSAKLGSQRRCDDFMGFAGRYVQELEEDIYKLQPFDEDVERNGDSHEGPSIGNKMITKHANF